MTLPWYDETDRDTVILPLPRHSDDCPVCGGPGRVRVSAMRWRGGVQVADPVASVEPCPFRSGADVLALMVRGAVLPDGPGGGAA